MSKNIPTDIFQDWAVLIVDDDPDSLEIVDILLSAYGANVITASNGKQGLDLAKARHPRFIISDLSMDEMTGWELVDALKLDRTMMDIPIFAFTAHAMSGDREKAIAHGFHNYLVKPIRADTFMEQLIAILLSDIPELALKLGR
jgi:two-component system, cell cycle response regulator DivK